MGHLAQEGQALDKTIQMTNTIVQMGVSSASSLQGQTSRLRNTKQNLGKLERSALPGADRLITMVNKADRRNTIILAFVISVCLVILLHSLGVIQILKQLLATDQKTGSDVHQAISAHEAAHEAMLEPGST